MTKSNKIYNLELNSASLNLRQTKLHYFNRIEDLEKNNPMDSNSIISRTFNWLPEIKEQLNLTSNWRQSPLVGWHHNQLSL